MCRGTRWGGQQIYHWKRNKTEDNGATYLTH